MDIAPLQRELQRSRYAPALEAHDIHGVIDLLNAPTDARLPEGIPAALLIARLPESYFRLPSRWRKWLALLARCGQSVPASAMQDLFTDSELAPFTLPSSRMELLYGAGAVANLSNVQAALCPQPAP